MTDWCRTLGLELGVPVIDGVAAAVKLAEALVALGLRTSKLGDLAAPLAKPMAGMMRPFEMPGTPD
jgi:allantoin racemase